jgi:hypothetical protein
MHLDDVPLVGLDEIDGISNDIELYARFDGSEGMRVQEVSISDALNGLPVCSVRLAGLGSFASARALLRKSCEVEIHRPGQKRHFRGIKSIYER